MKPSIAAANRGTHYNADTMSRRIQVIWLHRLLLRRKILRL
jgi:hypothetical protein